VGSNAQQKLEVERKTSGIERVRETRKQGGRHG